MSVKTLHIEAGKNLYGGALQVFYLLKHLNVRGHECALVCDSRSAIRKACEDTGIHVYPIKMGGDMDLSIPGKLKKILREYKPDLFHIHSRRGADTWGGRAARAMGIPAVISRRVDNPEPPWLCKWKYAPYSRIITISEGIRQVMLSQGVSEDKLRLARSAYDFSEAPDAITREDFLKRFGLPENSLTVGLAAQLIPRKGHRFLFEAAAGLISQHPQLRILCFGKGAELKNLEKQTTELGLQNVVQFVGFIDDLLAVMPQLDILAHPALMEGLGISLIQASYCKVPIIASAVGGIPEIVKDGENGLLVTPGDVPALQNALKTLIKDPKKRTAMGERGHEIATSEFSVENMVDANLKIYSGLIT